MSPHFPHKQHEWPIKYIMGHCDLPVPPPNLGILTRSTKHDKYLNKNNVSPTTSQKSAI